MSHGDIVSKLPKNFKVVAYSDHSPNAIIADEKNSFMEYNFTRR